MVGYHRLVSASLSANMLTSFFFFFGLVCYRCKRKDPKGMYFFLLHTGRRDELSLGDGDLEPEVEPHGAFEMV